MQPIPVPGHAVMETPWHRRVTREGWTLPGCEHYAVNRTPRGRLWAVTHRASGVLIAELRTREQALACMVEVAAVPRGVEAMVTRIEHLLHRRGLSRHVPPKRLAVAHAQMVIAHIVLGHEAAARSRRRAA